MSALSPAHSAFGNEVRTCRRERELTQEDVSRATGLHVTYISQVERGIKNVSLANILKLSHALGCPAARLVAAAESALS